MKKVISASSAAKADKTAIENGIPSARLMAIAAEGLCDNTPKAGKVAVVCGAGNNGGDGYALAALFAEQFECITVISVAPPKTEDSVYYRNICLDKGVNIVEYREGVLCGHDTVVDCVFGVGLSRRPNGIYERAINEINSCGAYVVSADIPSGLHADSGLAELAVKADITVTFAEYKAGLILNDGRDYSGRIAVHGIGTEPAAVAYLAESSDFSQVLAGRRRNCNKGTYGYVSIIGGCREYAGAIKLSNLALSALKCGCGVARLCVPDSLEGAVSPYILESTLCFVPDNKGAMLYDEAAIDKCLAGTVSAAVGMGWGSGEHNEKILSYILESYKGKLIIDADALNALSRMGCDVLRRTAADVVITPHPGEFSRLTGKSVTEILQDPICAASSFAKEYGVTVLLKGCTTVITDGDNTVLSNTGCAGMATAGSGDVLAGVLCGLFGHSTESAVITAACGAYLTGLAAQAAQGKCNDISMTASDTVACLGEAINEIKRAF